MTLLLSVLVIISMLISPFSGVTVHSPATAFAAETPAPPTPQRVTVPPVTLSNSPSLLVNVDVTPKTLTLGSVFTATITVFNQSTFPANNVQVSLPLPAGARGREGDPAFKGFDIGWRWTSSQLGGDSNFVVQAVGTVEEAPTGNALVARANATATGLQVPISALGGALLVQSELLPTTVAFTPGVASVLRSQDGRVEVQIPADVASEPLIIQLSSQPDAGEAAPPQRAAYKTGFPTFYLKAIKLPISGGLEVTSFAKPITIKHFYSQQELLALGIEESDLSLFWYDESQAKKQWVPLATQTYASSDGPSDPPPPPPSDDSSSTPAKKPGPFQLSDLSSPSEAFIPSLKGWQVGLFTGNLTDQYPIDVPAGPGGIKPSLSLGYSSSATDGRAGMRRNQQSSWVGKGWSLDTGYVALNKIVNEAKGDRYYNMVLNGQSLNLQKGPARAGVTNPQGWIPAHWEWHPTDETFLKIQAVEVGPSGRYNTDAGEYNRGGHKEYASYKWQVWTKDGTMYEFANEAWQGWRMEDEACPEPDYTYLEPYKWHLTSVVDTHGNKITYNYERLSRHRDVTCGNQRIWGQVDYSVWPTSITWGTNIKTPANEPDRFKVEFVSDQRVIDTNPEDAPNHIGGGPRETRQLRAIKVLSNQAAYDPANPSAFQNSWLLMRQYNLRYQEGSQPEGQQNYLLSDTCIKQDDGRCLPDYGSPKLTLKGIRELAKDGTTALPENTFDYGLTRGEGEYPQGGWNRLTRVDNGQGGVMDVTYDVVGASLNPHNPHFKNNRRVTARAMKDGMGTGPEHEHTWLYRYEGPQFNSLGKNLSANGNDDPATNVTPNSATLYFNKYWDLDHSYERVLFHKERSEFRGHAKVTERNPTGHETEHYFYQGDHPCGVPRENQQDPNSAPVTGNAITSHSCFQAIRTREFLKGREWRTVTYSGLASQNVKLNEVERKFEVPLVDPSNIDANNANSALPGLWRSFSHESETAERSWEGTTNYIEKKTFYTYHKDASGKPVYGNLKEVREEQNGAVLRSTTLGYLTKDTPDPSAPSGYVHLVDRKRTEDIKDSQGRWLAKTVYGYDHFTGDSLGTKGELTLIRKYHDLPVPPSATLPDLLHSSDTSCTYDDYGNQKTLTTYEGYGESRSNGTSWGAAGGNSIARTMTTHYETTFNTYPVRYDPPALANGLVLSQSATYDYRMGTITSITDANGVLTKVEYDEFGRMVKLIKHNDTSELPTVQATYYDYNRPFRYIVGSREVSGSNASRPIIKFYDGLGQEIQTKSETEEGTQHVVADKVYDGMGQVKKQSQPRYVNNAAGSAAFWDYAPRSTDSEMKWTTTEYDGLGRSTRVSPPDSKATTMAYGHGINTRTGAKVRQVVTRDAKGRKKAHLSDLFGRLVQVKEFDNPDVEASAITTYEYNPLDLLQKVIDAYGKEITVKFDSLGRKVEMTDLTMGRWTYTYNPSGALKTQADNNPTARSITFLYDAMDRLLTKSYSDGSHAEYRYDDTANGNKGKGQLTSTERYAPNSQTPQSRIQYHYDERGQKTRTTFTLPELSATILQTYDAAGRVTSTTYPSSGEKVNYTYDSAWRQTRACSEQYAGLCYAHSARYTALDQPDEYKLGNNLLQDFIYSSPMQRLSQIVVGSLFNRTYGYDDVGNVTSISSSGQFANPETQTFDYDHLDRLKTWTLQVQAHGGSITSQGYEYDLVGNITKKAGVTYTYDHARPAGGGGPYAVRNDGNSAYSYDANGNLATGGGRSYQWNIDNQPTSITSGGVTETYTYDADGERIKKVRDGVTTFYIGGVYEQDGTDSGNNTRRYFYSLQGQIVAQREVVTTTSGGGDIFPCDPLPKEPCPTPVPPGTTTTDTLIYLHRDHLGSASMTTSSAGEVQGRQEFDPWGKVRTGGITQTKLNFTGQKLDSTGLLYYHARYYDPSLARFASPDTIVPGVSMGAGGAVGTVGKMQNHNLTVDFHETQFLQSLRQEHSLVQEEGFWAEDRKISGPMNPQALNRYAYVLNNPVRFIDPTGHAVPLLLAAALALGGSVVTDVAIDAGAACLSGNCESFDAGSSVVNSVTNPLTYLGPLGKIGKIFKIGKYASFVDNAGKALKFKPVLTQGSKKSRKGLEHIVYNHWHSSGTVGKSKFGKHIGLRELRGLINEAADSGSPWKLEGTALVQETNMGRIIGTDELGRPTSWLRVIADSSGEVVTAYPIGR
ncbi:MAG: hypothetical protein M3437_11825 [Chloroflexota bacterium]|nr:hypothetical protein [Chloroflexota bacterium]MDQ5866133.1 hypothetical protein [Chloroflexota bacterium]